MAWNIYNIDGDNLLSAYNLSGDSVSIVYDIEGNAASRGTLHTYNMMTFNCQNWTDYNANTPVITAMFEQYDPVIVGLQECRTNGGYVPNLFEREYQSTDGSMLMMFANTILSNFTTIPFEDNRGQYRAYQKGTITLDGKTITIFNTHIEYSPKETRIAQLQELLSEFALCESFICLGDFNLVLKSNSGDQYYGFVKPMIDAGYNSANWTPETGYVDTYFSGETVASSGEKDPCDSIITSPDISILSIAYDDSKIVPGMGTVIDHIPVIATIGFYVEEETT